MHCRKCKYEGEGLIPSWSKKRKDGSKYYQYLCRPCVAERKRRERQRNPNASKLAEKNYITKYPERYRARVLAKRKILLEPCEVCGDKKSHRHHPDYSKPLEVKFLCALHHKQVHQGVL